MLKNKKPSHEETLRRLRYRLKRQGMLELDVWLSPLQQALEKNDERVTKAIDTMIAYEAPELLDMQTGSKPIPEELKPWLNTLV